MKTTLISLIILLIITSAIFAQDDKPTTQKPNLKEKKEPVTNWSLNLTFSDNGFGFGATKFTQLGKDAAGFASIEFSGAKDDREFEQYDIYGNSFTPDKVNRLFMSVMSIGAQFRLFREDVTDNLRPHINIGMAPTMILYTPYNQSFLSSFKWAQAKYTVGAFAGIGLDYVTNKHTSLNMDIRYYYINLFGQGVYSISTNEKKYFGGVYFVFSYNFMH
jgi:outer membrane protein W